MNNNTIENKFNELLKKMNSCKNLIHCITNPIAINDMANVILCLNMSPFMADNPKEVEEVTKKADSLLINLGNIQDYRMESMLKSIKVANEENIPICLDLVGISASTYRLDFVLEILNKYHIDVIKGNYSEIKSLYIKNTTTKGVDSKSIDCDECIKFSNELSLKYKNIILATGLDDIISEDGNAIILSNGDVRLSKITGTGCILGGIVASVLSIEKSIDSVMLATSIINISAERVRPDVGLQSFKLSFLDEISLINNEKIMEKLKWQTK